MPSSLSSYYKADLIPVSTDELLTPCAQSAAAIRRLLAAELDRTGDDLRMSGNRLLMLVGELGAPLITFGFRLVEILRFYVAQESIGPEKSSERSIVLTFRALWTEFFLLCVFEVRTMIFLRISWRPARSQFISFLQIVEQVAPSFNLKAASAYYPNAPDSWEPNPSNTAESHRSSIFNPNLKMITSELFAFE